MIVIKACNAIFFIRFLAYIWENPTCRQFDLYPVEYHLKTAIKCKPPAHFHLSNNEI
jgi:hypothetical protein